MDKQFILQAHRPAGPAWAALPLRAAQVALATMLAFALAPAQAADPVKIGFIGPLTGGSSSQGVPMRNGVRLAVEEINKSGGVLGRQIQLVERDDEARNEVGAQVAQELISKEGVVAVVGFVNTGVALASQRFFQEAEIPVMTAVATGSIVTRQFLPPEHKYNYIFRLAASDTIQSALIVDQAIGRLGFKRPAIMADSTNYGQLGREDLERALVSKGVKPVVVEKFNIKDTDMTAQLLRAKAAGADVLLTYGVGPELAQIANGMAKLGWKVPMIGSWPLSNSSFIDTAGANGEGAMMPQTFIHIGNTPRRKAFIDAYLGTYKVPRIPTPVAAAQGYDAMLLLGAAIRQAKATQGAKIREALESLDGKVEGVITVYSKPYSAQDHEAISYNMPVFGLVKGGEIVPARQEDVTGDKVVRYKERK